MQTQQDILHAIIEAGNLVFFGGAGVSTESGIPDFRSSAGIFHSDYANMPAEVIVSSDTFWDKPDIFYGFYFNKMVFPDAVPNAAHIALAKLEERGLLNTVITQNIDGLHQKAGSKKVLELHGSIYHNTCVHCGMHGSLQDCLKSAPNVPLCPKCKGMMKPEVVLYGEALNQQVLEEAMQAIEQANTLIIGGTSLGVYPAAGLIQYFKGDHIVLINKATTNYDQKAELVIHEPIGEVLKPWI